MPHFPSFVGFRKPLAFDSAPVLGYFRPAENEKTFSWDLQPTPFMLDRNRTLPQAPSSLRSIRPPLTSRSNWEKTRVTTTRGQLTPIAAPLSAPWPSWKAAALRSSLRREWPRLILSSGFCDQATTPSFRRPSTAA